jgi:GTP pyrophosphokinase
VESLRRLLVATANDIRVIIVKLADRLHNMETIQYVESSEKRLRVATETMEVYVPIAERLGIGVLKSQLEDLAFAVIEPEQHQKIAAYLKNESEKAAGAIEEAKNELSKALQENGMRSFRLESRIKSIHSFAKKLARRGNDVDKIYDTFAIRLIVPTIEDCYRALGIVHALWRPMIGRLKDYIADQKPNGYRAIHTTILTRQKIMMEIQIRSEDMNREAQFGVASHFEYKEREAGGPREIMPTIVWLRQFIPSLMKKKQTQLEESASSAPGWLKELNDVAENFEEHAAFQKVLKEDFFAERMFTFTPQGDVIDLPVGATPIDFAYAIHSDIGNAMMGAKVNGKMTQLTALLRNGDIVEILTRKSARPNRKWLEYVKTSSAKHHIKTALHKMELEKR